MQCQTGLLLLSTTLAARVNGQSILSDVLKRAALRVRKNLYIHIYSPDGASVPNLFSKKPSTAHLISSSIECYAQATKSLPSHSVNVLLRYGADNSATALAMSPEIVLTDTALNVFSASLQQALAQHFCMPRNIPLVSLEVEPSTDIVDPDLPNIETHKHCALGGTFDRIHSGHKVLLGTALALAEESLTVGVTDENMNRKKVLCEMIQPIYDRLAGVETFVTEVRPDLTYNIVPIQDPFGPTITEKNLDCLIVSEETQKGGTMVNERRQLQGWHTLHIHEIPLVEDLDPRKHQDKKVSSSSGREALLGQLVKPVKENPNLPKDGPYMIGLTGGIASGKSSIGKRLEALGSGLIMSDLVAHDTYKKGSPSYHEIVNEFGEDILSEKGEIERRKLGAKVFADKLKLEKLNGIVWPATEALVKDEMQRLYSEGKRVCFVEAALLLEANWQDKLHEVWTCVIPEAEAEKRLMERNKMTLEEAQSRIRSQASNQFRVDRSNVVLSTLWDPSITQKQVEKAWTLLQERLI